MATLATLLDVETEVESAFKTHFAATPYNLAAIGSDTALEVVTPRLEIVAKVQKWGPHQIVATTGTYAGREVYDQFVVNADLDLIYEPEAAQSPGSLRGTMRAALTDWTAIQAAFVTHNYLFPTGSTLRQVGGDRVIQDSDKSETLRTTLELVVMLNPAALAVAT